MSDLANKLAAENIRITGGARQGNHKALCPKCSHARRKKTDPCLSVTVDADGAVWNCHNAGCGFAGSTSERKGDVVPMRKKPAKPDYKSEALPAHISAWLKGRGISDATLMRNDVGYDSGRDAIAFPARRKGEVINIKYRKLPKAFSQVTGAEQIFFGLDDIGSVDTAIIVEGEMDKLSCEMAGFTNVISLPSGAIKAGNGAEAKQTEFVRNSWEEIKHIKNWILAGDNDEPGQASQEELARILGREKCRFVVWPTAGDALCKDANEVLLTHGAEVLRECIELAKPYPIPNLVELDDDSSIIQLYRNGRSRALSTGWACMDDYYRVGEGILTVVTGTPGSGKSEVVDALMVNLARDYGWKHAVCSFENPLDEHRAKLSAKYLGLPFWDGPSVRMSEADLARGLNWLREHFFFMRFGEESPTIDAILETARAAVMRHGIRGLVIDPYNEIEHKRPATMSETEYVSEMLSKVKRFAQNHGVHVWFIAHPAKITPDKDGKRRVPTLSDISGSANWLNKADIGFVVHLDPNRKGEAEIHIRKVRHQPQHGQRGMVKLNWDKKTGRYSDPADVQRNDYSRRYQE